MIRLLTGVLLSFVAGIPAMSQTGAATAPEDTIASPRQFDRAQVAHLIVLNELAVRDGEATHADTRHLVMYYSNLGNLYEDAGMYLKAEDAIRRAVLLLKDGPRKQLADELEQLATLHAAMDNTRQAEKEEIQDLRIRTAVGEPVGIAAAQGTLAALYDAEGKFPRALDYAEKAYDVLADREDVAVLDRIGVRHTLGYALTGLRSCDRGIALLKDALELSKSSPAVSITKVGYGEFLLGFGYSNCGDREHASEWLERGTTDMRADFGCDRIMYVSAMKKYARFLRESGQLEAANSVESVVVQAESIVDANTLTGRVQGFRSAGSK
jgi:tetratricopeptide (TPR) repeat protein